jgi:hypothetical protein
VERVHPVADEWTDEHMVLVVRSGSVLLTDALAAFLGGAVDEGVRPVLVTAPGARVSPLAGLALGRAGAFWAVRDGGAVYDGLSGHRVERFADLWAPARVDQPRLPGFSEAPATSTAVAMFEVYAHHRVSGSLSMGALADLAVTGLGGAALDVWGSTEPLASGWDDAALTETIRRTMPDSDVVHAASPDGSFVAVSAGRTPRGVMELVKGGVPVGAYPGSRTEVLDAATTMLTRAHDAFRPAVAMISLAEFDDGPAGPVQTASARRPEVPVAALLGPTVVHDLGLQLAELERRHDVTVLGRRRTPSLLVRFSREQRGAWDQLIGFAADLGLDRVQRAMDVGVR